MKFLLFFLLLTFLAGADALSDEAFDKMIKSPPQEWESIVTESHLTPSSLTEQRPRLRALLSKNQLTEAIGLAHAMDFAGALVNGTSKSDNSEQIGLGLYLARQNKFEAADQVASYLKGHSPTAGNTLYLQGILLARRNPTAALNLLQQAVAAGDLSAAYLESAMGQQAGCLFQMGKTAESQKAYEDLLRLYPSNAMAKDALRALNGQGEKMPDVSNNAMKLFEQAEQAFQAGKFQQAIRLYDQALSADPKFAKAAVYRGDAWFQLGDSDKATASYRQAIAIDPNDKQAHRFLGDVLERKYELKGDKNLLREAIRCYEEAVRIDPNYALGRDSLNKARERLNRP